MSSLDPSPQRDQPTPPEFPACGIEPEVTHHDQGLPPAPASLFPTDSIPPDSERPGKVQDQDFSLLGLDDSEVRLWVIRSAAEKSILRASKTKRSPVSDRSRTSDPNSKVAKLVAAAYRLIDPRYRDSQFHRIRVGRVLPLALQKASHAEFCGRSIGESEVIPADSVIAQAIPASSLAASDVDLAASDVEDADVETPCLFGVLMPLTLTPETGDLPADGATIPHSQAAQSSIAKPPVTSADGDRNQTLQEAAEVMAELKASRWQPRMPGFLRRPLAVVVISALLASGTLLASWAAWGPDRSSTQIQVAASNANSPVELNSESTAELRSETIASPSETEGRSSEPVNVPRSVDRVTEPESNNEPKAIVENPDNDRAAMDSVSRIELPRESGSVAIESANPDSMPAAPLDAGEDSVATTSSDEPASPVDTPRRSFSADEIEAAITELWESTETKYSEFTSEQMVALMDRWDLMGDLSGPGSLPSIASEHLKLRAAWLVSPFDQVVAQVRQLKGPQSAESQNAAPLRNRETVLLNESELQLCLLSWRKCREKVSRTTDLQRLLKQGNVMMDAMLTSPLISSSERQFLLSSFQLDLSRLSRLAADDRLAAETESILDAVESLPSPSELRRMESRPKPSGVLARIRCLSQRRWDDSLRDLSVVRTPAISACAKAELELRDSFHAVDEEAKLKDDVLDLATRWQRVADRLSPAEASNIRLHVITMCNDFDVELPQREQLIAQLPEYLAPFIQ